MSKPFDEFLIKNLLLKNRFVMSAALNLNEANQFAILAKEEVGLIISGGLQLDEIQNFEKIIKDVHAYDGKIALQLVSSGGQFGFGQDPDPIAVSVLKEDNSFFNPLLQYSPHHEATDAEIEKIIEDYANSAILAKQMGADAVQIHSAHQSFLSQFLSPITNKRRDKWGGSIQNRTRVHQAIYESIRAKVGDELPILIKIGVADCLENGLAFPDGLAIASLLASYGYDALEISQGLQDFQRIFTFNDWSGLPMQVGKKELYFRNWTKEVKKRVSVPIIMMGGIKSYQSVEEMLKNNEADLFSLCRPLIREPNLISRWKRKDFRPAQCVSCNQCLTEIYMKGQPLGCFLEKNKAYPRSS